MKGQLSTEDAKAIVRQVQSMLDERGYDSGLLPQAAASLLLVHGMACLECDEHDPHILELLTAELRAVLGYVLEHLHQYNEAQRACLNERLS